MSVAEDNPAALQLPVRQGHRRREPRRRADHAGLDRADPGRVPRRAGRHGQDDRRRGSRTRASSATAGRSSSSRSINDLTGDLQQGTFILRKNMTPDQLVNALLAPPDVKYVDIGLRTGLRLEQITAKLQTLARLTMDPQEFYDLVEVAAGRAPRRLPVAQEDPGRRAEGRLARGLPVAGDLPRPARHDARGARPADARQVHRRTSDRSGWTSRRRAA